MITKRILQLSPSPTLALDKKAKELQEQGKPVVNLSIGEPDFPTPEHICDAAIRGMKEGFTHYTLTAGILPLRKAIAAKLETENHLEYDPSEIVAGVGTKQLLYNAFQVLLQKGNEALVPTPTWSTYVEQIKLAEATPVLVPLKSPFKLSAEDLIPFITEKTKVLILNSPSNPTGAMIEKEELEKIAKLAVERDIFIIADEIYEKLTYGPKHVSIASLSEEIKKRTLTINGFSKSYAMTGWRIGYAAGPKEIIQGMVNLQGQTTSNTSSIAQVAGIAAIEGTQEPVNEMKKEFEKRREYLIKEFEEIKDLSFSAPEGAFYFFVKTPDENSAAWCEKILQEKFVAVVPGEAFCYPGYFRMSYAASMESLEEGVKRIKEFINKK